MYMGGDWWHRSAKLGERLCFVYGALWCVLALGPVFGGMMGVARESLIMGSIPNELRLWVGECALFGG